VLRTIDIEGTDPDRVIEQVEDSMSDDVALVSLSHVHYKSGMAFDLSRITKMVQAHGASMLWDLSHSVGALPIDIETVGAEGAVGCTYKYLNGGPGAPAFMYVRRDLQPILRNPIQGWFGAQKPFEFSTQYEPSSDVQRFLVGTPAILSTAAVEPGVDLVLEAGVQQLRERSIRMSEYFISQIDSRLAHYGFDLQTPRQPEARGSHVSIGHDNAWQITQALIQEYCIIPDFRQPNTVRFGITPLYTTYSELDRAVNALGEIVELDRFACYSAQRLGVT
jgi:kynureninase